VTDRPLEVLQLGKFYHPHRGGMETYLKSLCDDLRGRVSLEVLVAGDGPRTLHDVVDGVAVTRTASIGGRPLTLSAHETGVLEVLVNRFGRVVSKEQLVEQVYSYDKEVSHNAIEVYVHRLRKKIAGAGVTVRTLYGQGYLLDYVSH